MRVCMCVYLCVSSLRMRRRHQTAAHEVVKASRQNIDRRHPCQQVSALAHHLSASHWHCLVQRGHFTQNMMTVWQTWSSQRRRLLLGHAIHYCCCLPPRDNSTHDSLTYQRKSLVQSAFQVCRLFVLLMFSTTADFVLLVISWQF